MNGDASGHLIGLLATGAAGLLLLGLVLMWWGR